MFGLQSKKSGQLVDEIANEFETYFGDKIDTISIYNVTDTPYPMFNFRFELYNSFIIEFSYNRGAIGCGINFGNYGVDVKNNIGWYDLKNIGQFCKELDEDIRLRIPDKFLQRKGWLK